MIDDFLNKWVAQHPMQYHRGFGFRLAVPRIECKDGFSVSVQASPTTYCTPRDGTGPYTAFEVGFPSEPPPDSWNEYCDTPGDVWGYVPAYMIEELLISHEGPTDECLEKVEKS